MQFDIKPMKKEHRQNEFAEPSDHYCVWNLTLMTRRRAFGLLVVALLPSFGLAQAPPLVEDAVAEDDLAYIKHVSPTYSSLTLDGLAKLETLDMAGSLLNDAGMVHLQRLVRLKKLSIANTIVGDSGIDSLRGIKGLETLDFAGTRVSHVGLSGLKDLK